MNEVYVLDASALLRFTDKEAGHERVGNLIKAAARGRVRLLISAVNWGEIAAAVYKRTDRVQSATLRLSNYLATIASLPLAIVEVDRTLAETAAMFRCNFGVPYADAFAGALTLQYSGGKREQATLVTADYDFKNVPSGTINIDFLPTK